ncbi:MAG TPA: glycosyl hydrolase 53 family protein [Acidobacteriaceae bacterium]|nr:glycosyl hydrolase 53 family protein [Acidobacteriaceae bacterium]
MRTGRWVMWALLLCACLCAVTAGAQTVIAGADVSFLRQMEQRGVQFKDAGVAKPGLEILKDHGYTWVRLRVMVNPISLPNDQAYTIALAKDAKARGFKLLLDFHYSDDWADPGHQWTPRAWQKMSHAELVQATFAYTRDTIAAFRKAHVMPDMVQVGNEVTAGMMWPDGRLPGNWPQFADLLKAGIRGVKKGSGWGHRPLIMVHIDKGGNWAATKSFLDHLEQYGVRYDVVGQSYYPWWQGSLDGLRENLTQTWVTFHKPTMVVETAYDWRTGEDFKGKTPPFPETPEGQREFLEALKKVAGEAPGGKLRGIFWWEPMAGGGIAKRDLFDDEHEALPAIHVFDPVR